MAFTFPRAARHPLFPYTTHFRSLAWATTVYNPDGSRLWGDNCCGNTWVETGNLPQAGTYKIFLDPVGALTGTLTITAYDVPPDATQAITIGGASAMLSNTVPGQNMSFTFSATTGQNLT